MTATTATVKASFSNAWFSRNKGAHDFSTDFLEEPKQIYKSSPKTNPQKNPCQCQGYCLMTLSQIYLPPKKKPEVDCATAERYCFSKSEYGPISFPVHEYSHSVPELYFSTFWNFTKSPSLRS